MDIIFRNEQPSAAVPGGSVFNGIVSLSRTGVPVCFISETGNDHVGDTILRFMRDNHISTEHVNVFPDGKSPVSLAFLNDNSDAEYIFYKDYPKQRLDIIYPELKEDDIVVIGSYYALNPVLREKVLAYLDPGISVTIIENGKAVRKEKPMPPKRLVNIVKCRNPRCISSIEEECDQIFELSSNGKYRCIYCEQELQVKPE